jgi:hypothetical protein
MKCIAKISILLPYLSVSLSGVPVGVLAPYIVMTHESVCLLIKTNHDIYLLPQELEDPLIIIHEKKISNINSIVKVLELALKVSSAICITLH